MLDDLLKFVEFTNQFRAVERTIILPKLGGRNENDAEHTFQLAMTAWYIISTKGLGLDIDLVLKYALVHDLVEVYAGDTPALMEEYESERETKHEREEKAVKELRENFSQFEDMHYFIEKYEKQEDEESRFVYSLDKIVSVMNIYLDKGHSWKVHNIKLEELLKNKTPKVQSSEEVRKYFELLVERLKREERSIFPIE